jgi:hypothetical protein
VRQLDRLREGRHLPLVPIALGDRIKPLTRELAQVRRLFARLGEGEVGIGAEAEIAPLTIDLDPQHPCARAAGADVQEQALAVVMSARFGGLYLLDCELSHSGAIASRPSFRPSIGRGWGRMSMNK